MITTQPASVSSPCARALSHRDPPNEANSSAPNAPKVANTVICSLPMTSKHKANSAGTITVARSDLIKAALDQLTRRKAIRAPYCRSPNSKVPPFRPDLGLGHPEKVSSIPWPDGLEPFSLV